MVATYLIDLIAPPLKLPDWVHQLALTAHLGQPMIGAWDPVGIVACLVIAIGGIALGAWGFARRDVPPARAGVKKNLGGGGCCRFSTKGEKKERTSAGDHGGLSQGQLAAELRVSRQTVNAIETGRYLPSLPLAFTIARFFGRRIEEVFHDDVDV